MVLGLRSKTRKSSHIKLDYTVNVQEIKPWHPLKSLQSLLLQWQNGDHSSGILTPNIGADGIFRFNDPFNLPVTLRKDSSSSSSKKRSAQDSFKNNFLEFNLYEPRGDKSMKGQLLGSAVINLADCGILDDTVSITTPLHLKKSSKNLAQPLLYLTIKPFDGDSTSSLSKQVSLRKDGTESASEVNDVEISEIASFTDDDIDGDVDGSSQSSRTASSLALESGRGSPISHDKNGSGSTKRDTETVSAEPTWSSEVAPPSSGIYSSATYLSSSMHDPTDVPTFKIGQLNDHSQVSERNHIGFERSQDREAGSSTGNVRIGFQDNFEINEKQDDGCDAKSLEANELVTGKKLPQDGMKKQANWRSNTLISNRTQSNTRRDKLKHLKSVQLQFHSVEIDETFAAAPFLKNANKNDISDNVLKGGTIYKPSERKERTNTVSGNANEQKPEIKVSEEKEVDLPKNVTDGGVCDVSNNLSKGYALYEPSERKERMNTVSGDNVEQKPEITKNVNKGAEADALSETKGGNMMPTRKEVEQESEVELLKEELMEAAALEVSLYSVVAEHGSSTNKVHAPARRLSRFYLHACKGKPLAIRASSARAIVSGLVLVSKACGNDVPRLTFWLSNSIVLRTIVSQANEKLPSHSTKRRYEAARISKKECSDEWEDPQTIVVALEKVEAWIFSRIVESIWWQTLTPHMQSAAVKGSSSSRKSQVRKSGMGGQDQGTLAIELWKKAFKDACERLCPVRSGGHECGCLTLLARLVMEQLVGRLDVAMFNAILRESDEDMPTDPVSDPISDPKVLPVPAGKSSFSAGAQLKNAVGNWSRWLTDLFGIDDTDSFEDNHIESDRNHAQNETSFKAFHLLNALSDLMMLPFEMLADKSTRKEVCPVFGEQLIKRVLYNFVPDEFNPDPIPDSILDALDSEDPDESSEMLITGFPCSASPIIYSPPPTISLLDVVGMVGGHALLRTGSSLLKKSYTSDDELDELDAPMSSIIVDNSRASPTSANLIPKGDGGRKVVRYQLLRKVWKHGD